MAVAAEFAGHGRHVPHLLERGGRLVAADDIGGGGGQGAAGEVHGGEHGSQRLRHLGGRLGEQGDVVTVAEEFGHKRAHGVEAGLDHLLRGHGLPQAGQHIGDEVRGIVVIRGADDSGIHPSQRSRTGGHIALDSGFESVLRVFGADRLREVDRRVERVDAGRDRSDVLCALGIHIVILWAVPSQVNGYACPSSPGD